MRTIQATFQATAFIGLLAAGCQGQTASDTPEPIADPAPETGDQPGGIGGNVNGTVPGTAPEPDPVLPYPPGPYGVTEGDILSPHVFPGYVDDNGNGLVTDDATRDLSLGDFHVGADPDARILLVNASAGWCGACRFEAGHLSEMSRTYGPKGARFVTVLFEDNYGNTPTLALAHAWATSYAAPFPILIDPTFAIGAYFDENATPMNMWVDPSTMEILSISFGFDAAETEAVLRAYTN